MTTEPATWPLSDRIRCLSGQDNWRTEPIGDLAPLVLADGPHGVRKPSDGQLGIGQALPATCFPTAAALASTWDPDLLEEVGAALGREARARDVDVLLGPGLNLKRHPAGGRNFEYLSEDPLLSGRLAAALVRGIQSQGVAACPKHFAANNQESNRLVVDTIVDDRTLHELYLTGFEIVVRESAPWTVMAAYNRLNGTYCTDHRGLLTGLLREEWGFDGVVMSDWGATNDRANAVAAGMDLEMPGSGKAFDDEVAAAVRRGRIDEADVDRSVARLAALARRVRGARADRPLPPVDQPPDDAAAHHALARRAAAAGTVLLVNDGLLPLAGGGRLAVVGGFAVDPRYQGAGSSQVTPTAVDAALPALRARLGDPTRDGDTTEVTYAAGYDERGDTSDALVAAAVDVAAAADAVVVFAGLPGAYESEGFDRDHLRLPDGHTRVVEAVLEANPRTVVVLANGAPVELPWADRVAALVEGYLGGQAGGSAIVDVLVGDAEPGGRLAESFPVALTDLPADANFPGHPKQVVYRETLWVGYRFHDTAGVPARFPFGHGLSYTTFAWDRLTVTGEGHALRVEIDVTNTGARPGHEVVQVYVRDPSASVPRPDRELRGFTSVHLDPGETRRVGIDLGRRAFAFFDPQVGDWRVEAGRFEVLAAASSTDVRARATVEVPGDDPGGAHVTPSAPWVADDATFAALLGHAVPAPDPVVPLHRNSSVTDLAHTPLGRRVQPPLVAAASRHLQGALHEPDEATRRMFDTIVRTSPLRAMVLFGRGRPSFRALDRILWLLNARGRTPRE